MNTRIKELRKTLGMTLEKIGDRIGVSNSTFSAWELGERRCPESKLRLICTVFNVSRKWLETGEGDMFVAGKTREALDYEAFGRVAVKIYAALPCDLQKAVANAAREIVGNAAEKSEPKKKHKE